MWSAYYLQGSGGLGETKIWGCDLGTSSSLDALQVMVWLGTSVLVHACCPMPHARHMGLHTYNSMCAAGEIGGR